MIVYNYNKDTKEFLYSQEAELDTEESLIQGHNIYLLPANATFVEPPEIGEKQVAVYENGAWVVQSDFRGFYKVNSDMEPELIKTIGAIDNGFIVITPEQAEVIYNDKFFYIIKKGKLVENPHYDAVVLNNAKELKYEEALYKANEFLSGPACYSIDENNSIEATDGNIAKLTAFALGFQAETIETVYWTTKEDNVIELGQNEVVSILTGLGAVQSSVWNVQFIAYKQAIEDAQTISDLDDITIEYEVQNDNDL